MTFWYTLFPFGEVMFIANSLLCHCDVVVEAVQHFGNCFVCVCLTVNIGSKALAVHIVGSAPCYPDGARRDAPIAFACITGGCKGIVGVKEATGSAHHLFCDLATDHVMFCNVGGKDTQVLYLDMVLISYESALEVAGSPRYLSYFCGNASARTTFSRGQCLPTAD